MLQSAQVVMGKKQKWTRNQKIAVTGTVIIPILLAFITLVLHQRETPRETPSKPKPAQPSPKENLAPENPAPKKLPDVLPLNTPDQRRKTEFTRKVHPLSQEDLEKLRQIVQASVWAGNLPDKFGSGPPVQYRFLSGGKVEIRCTPDTNCDAVRDLSAKWDLSGDHLEMTLTSKAVGSETVASNVKSFTVAGAVKGDTIEGLYETAGGKYQEWKLTKQPR